MYTYQIHTSRLPYNNLTADNGNNNDFATIFTHKYMYTSTMTWTCFTHEFIFKAQKKVPNWESWPVKAQPLFLLFFYLLDFVSDASLHYLPIEVHLHSLASLSFHLFFAFLFLLTEDTNSLCRILFARSCFHNQYFNVEWGVHCKWPEETIFCNVRL